MPKIISISIEARMNSTRLPGKTLKFINGKPALEIMVNRVRRTKFASKIIIATTTNCQDDAIVEWCKMNNVNYFRGSENNVYERVLRAHQKFNTDIIVELTGDCILITAELIDYAIQLYLDNNYDYVSISDPASMSAQVYSLKILKSIKCNRKLEYLDKEHVTPYLYTSGKYKTLLTKMYEDLECPEVSFPLDTQQDLEVIEKICKNFDNFTFSFKEIVEFVKKNPDIAKINKNISRKGLT
jgi:spore coat polysaccharide biosynthesis protein SpsF